LSDQSFQPKEEMEMKLYGAIDLHSNNNVTVVSDEQDHVVYEKRLPNDLALITEQLSAYRDSLQGIVVESTYNWYWLVDGLMDEGHKIHLANTAAIQQYEGLKYTDDQYDARWLAHLLRLAILPQGYIYPKNTARCAICCVSAGRWCGSEPLTC
jgi:transposase